LFWGPWQIALNVSGYFMKHDILLYILPRLTAQGDGSYKLQLEKDSVI